MHGIAVYVLHAPFVLTLRGLALWFQAPAVDAAAPNGDLYAGGIFVTIDGVAANRVARWDGASWLPLGAGVSNSGWPVTVSWMTARPGGGVIVGVSFSNAGGLSALCVAQWNGSAWSSLSSGTNGLVTSLHTLSNGYVIATGSFSQAGGVAVADRRWSPKHFVGQVGR
ncbi:MAG: hypothetical protein ACJAYX_002549 [Planctomycetota bacterium]